MASADQAQATFAGLVASGSRVAELHLDEPTLEDAYLALTGTQPSTPPATMAATPA